MSFPMLQYSCEGCGFYESRIVQEQTYVYVAEGDRQEVRAYRATGWCYTCEGVREIEQVLSPEDLPLLEPGHAVVGGGEVSDRDVQEFWARLRLAKSRKSYPRCLTCGSQDNVVFRFE